VTARSLATVPGQIAMGNVSCTNGSVKLKVSQAPSLYSQQSHSISSSRRMLRIKGVKGSRNDYQKERFSEDVTSETRQIKNNLKAKRRTLSSALRFSQTGKLPDLSSKASTICSNGVMSQRS